MKNTQANIEFVLDLLYLKFPNRLPKESKSIEKINQLIGNQEVISYLEEYLERLKG
jgi:hypothetical protein